MQDRGLNSNQRVSTFMIEEMYVSHLCCFPSCFAFDRLKELITDLRSIEDRDLHVGEKLHSLLSDVNFTLLKSEIVKPVFLTGEGKHIPSLTLEFLSKTFLENQLITATELHALMVELKSFENREDTLIGLPGIYQVIDSRVI